MADDPTLLKSLLRRQHLQNHRVFCREYDKVASKVDRGLLGTFPSKSQFYRWINGELSGLPYADHCIILERMFPGRSAEELFGAPPVDGVEGIPDSKCDMDREAVLGAAVINSAEESLFVAPADNLLAALPHDFSADLLGGFWVTCYEYDSTCHADISQITPKCDRRVTVKNYPPEPRVEGRAVAGTRNNIEAELVNRHLVGCWKNVDDSYYFGAVHLAVLPGKTVMEGYYTCFLSDVQVVTARWKWVRLDPVSLSGVELSQVVLRDPRSISALVEEHSPHDLPLTLTAVTEDV